MIATLGTDGSIFFALSHANSNSEIILLFLKSLATRLDLEIPGW